MVNPFSLRSLSINSQGGPLGSAFERVLESWSSFLRVRHNRGMEGPRTSPVFR